jgi:hypothetical protein
MTKVFLHRLDIELEVPKMHYTKNGITVSVANDAMIPLETRTEINGERVVTVTYRKASELSRGFLLYYLKGLHAKQSRATAA